MFLNLAVLKIYNYGLQLKISLKGSGHIHSNLQQGLLLHLISTSMMMIRMNEKRHL